MKKIIPMLVLLACFSFTLALAASAGRWVAIDRGLPDSGAVVITTLAYDKAHDLLYTSIPISGSSSTTYLYRFDGTSWTIITKATGGSISDLACDSTGNLYVCGQFRSIGGKDISYLAKWDGSSFSAVGKGVNGLVKTIAINKVNNLFASGNFSTAGDKSANHIAMWDGTQWHSLGSGLNALADTLAFDNDSILFAGGGFSEAGGTFVYHTAQWDGTSWSPVGGGLCRTGDLGLTTISPVLALAGDKFYRNMYAGGRFERVGPAVRMYHISRWDGHNWQSVGTGFNHTVYALAVDLEGNVYAGGDLFWPRGMDTVVLNGIAKWEAKENRWAPLLHLNDPTKPGLICLTSDGRTVPGNINKIIIDNRGDLFVAGYFDHIGGTDIPVRKIAKWEQ